MAAKLLCQTGSAFKLFACTINWSLSFVNHSCKLTYPVSYKDSDNLLWLVIWCYISPNGHCIAVEACLISLCVIWVKTLIFLYACLLTYAVISMWQFVTDTQSLLKLSLYAMLFILIRSIVIRAVCARYPAVFVQEQRCLCKFSWIIVHFTIPYLFLSSMS